MIMREPPPFVITKGADFVLEERKLSMNKNSDQQKVYIHPRFERMGEGYGGDYNPDDPYDERLLRLTIAISRPIPGDDIHRNTTDIEGASTCTQFSTKTPRPVLNEALSYITDRVMEVLPDDATDEDADFSAVVRLMEALSWMGPKCMNPLCVGRKNEGPPTAGVNPQSIYGISDIGLVIGGDAGTGGLVGAYIMATAMLETFCENDRQKITELLRDESGAAFRQAYGSNQLPEVCYHPKFPTLHEVCRHEFFAGEARPMFCAGDNFPFPDGIRGTIEYIPAQSHVGPFACAYATTTAVLKEFQNLLYRIGASVPEKLLEDNIFWFVGSYRR